MITKEHYFGLKKEECAQKIQAVYKGYSIRKHFLAVKLRFERIVKNIEGSTEIEWKSNFLCFPIFHDSQLTLRLKEIEKRKQKLIQDLEAIEKAISDRKEYLKSK